MRFFDFDFSRVLIGWTFVLFCEWPWVSEKRGKIQKDGILSFLKKHIKIEKFRWFFTVNDFDFARKFEKWFQRLKNARKNSKTHFFYLSFVNDFLYIFPCFFSKYNLKSNHNIPQIIDLKISSFFCDSCDFLSFFFICGFFCNEYNCIFLGLVR